MASIKRASALKLLLRESYGQIYRVALILCGNRAAALAIVEKTVRQSMIVEAKWETDEDARRWFAHYTVLLSRDVHSKFDNAELLRAATDPETAAILSAIGLLPMQQREAFVLHHGESMDLRQLATAMDCSVAAAANHLVKAVNSLKESGLIGLGDFTARLPALMRQWQPAADSLQRDLDRLILIQRRRRSRRRLQGWLVTLTLVLGISWVGWWIWRNVVFD